MVKETPFSRNFNALHLFLTGGIIIPAYLFQTNLSVRVAQVLLFAALSVVAGKRIKWTYFIIMVLSITFFNLVTPLGQVLVTVGPFTITSGALGNGLMKGFTIVGLVFISLFSIRPDLKLPGRLGGMIGRVFYYFERVIEGKKKVQARRLIASMDEILMELYAPGTTQEAVASESRRTTAAGYVAGALLVLGNWALLLV